MKLQTIGEPMTRTPELGDIISSAVFARRYNGATDRTTFTVIMTRVVPDYKEGMTATEILARMNREKYEFDLKGALIRFIVSNDPDPDELSVGNINWWGRWTMETVPIFMVKGQDPN